MGQPLWKSLAVPQKVKQTVTIYPSNSNIYIDIDIDIYPRELNTGVQTKTCTQMFIAAL